MDMLTVEPQKSRQLPLEANPCFLVRAYTCGNLASRSLEVNIYGLFGINGDGMPKPSSSGARSAFSGLCGEIDAVGMPKPARGERSASKPVCPFDIDAVGMPKPNSRELPPVINLYVAALAPNGGWYQLDANGAWGTLTQPMAAYMTNVVLNEKSQKVYTPILNNVDLTGLVGARIFVGYGINSNEMIKTGRYREILSIDNQ
ncbi:putative RCC1 repeat-containing protein [Gammaproteobacteria bacterium]